MESPAGTISSSPRGTQAGASPRVLLGFKRGASLFGVLVLLALFLLPLAYGVFTSLKSESQLTAVSAPVLPASREKFESGGKAYDVYLVPMTDGTVKRLALVEKGRDSSRFMDPKDPGAPLVEWKGAWRALDAAWRIDFRWVNFLTA